MGNRDCLLISGFQCLGKINGLLDTRRQVVMGIAGRQRSQQRFFPVLGNGALLHGIEALR